MSMLELVLNITDKFLIFFVNVFSEIIMSKSRFVFDKFAKFLEEGLVNYKDFSDEVVNILRSKKEEIILKMNLVSKDEIDILNKRIEKL